MTRDDALTVACDVIPIAVYFAQGFSAHFAAAGTDERAWFRALLDHHPLQLGHAPTDEANLRLAKLALDICRDPQGLSAEELAGAWMLVMHSVLSRPSASAVIPEMVKAGVFEVAVAHLHKSSPVEWVSWRRADGLQASAIFTAALFVAQCELPKKTERMIDSGMADAVASLLKAYELRGKGETDEANAWGTVNAIDSLTRLDLSAPEARPIVQLLEGMGSALRFALDHPLEHFEKMGLTTSAQCAVRFRCFQPSLRH